MKRLSALCLVVLVALAGCTGGGGGGTPTDTATQTPIDGDVPPGVTAAGVDADALVSAHLDALGNRSYTMTVAQSSAGGDFSVTTRAGAGRVPALIDIDGQGATQELYVTTNGSYELRRASGGQIVRRTQGNASSVPTGEQYIRQALADGNLSYTGTVERDGQTLHRLRAGLSDLDRQIETGRATWFEVELLVDDAGLVHSLSYRLTVERDGSESDLRIGMDITDVGATSVSEPDWIDDVGSGPNATTRTLSNDQLGTALSVAGTTDNVTSVSIANASAAFYNTSIVEDARVSPLVTLTVNETVSVTDVRMDYDTDAIPGGNASELFVFVYYPEHQTFVQLVTTFDPVNETVRATRVHPDVTIDDETPTLDGLTGEYTFVVMHGQTYYEGFEERANS